MAAFGPSIETRDTSRIVGKPEVIQIGRRADQYREVGLEEVITALGFDSGRMTGKQEDHVHGCVHPVSGSPTNRPESPRPLRKSL